MMNENGGPAFPFGTGFQGMTLRDYFAAAALQGMLATPSNDYDEEHFRRTNYDEYAKTFAYSAYMFADKMMEARK